RHAVTVEDLSFCCQGCATVYSLLKANGLDDFYRIDTNAGQSQQNFTPKDYTWLDRSDLTTPFYQYQYQDGDIARVKLELPQIHCTSCIWLLENLSQLHPGIRSVSVNFAHRTAAICFAEKEISLRETAELLAKIGYPPSFQIKSGKKNKRGNRRLLYQIGLAGFTFGNIMLFSLPDYFGLDHDNTHLYFNRFFSFANLILSLPVLLYAGGDYLKAAYRGLKTRQLNIDLPISIGLLALFGRSAFEVLTQSGPGYFDSLAGLLFFLLIGRWFQDQTFKNLSFDHDYKSYFPLAANRMTSNGQIEAVGIGEIKAGDQLLIRAGDLIPADGILINDASFGIDYAFVTGESEPQLRMTGDQVYAGGRATKTSLEVIVEKSVDQSYLLQLWKEDAKEAAQQNRNLTDRASQYFTGAILFIATLTFIYWWVNHNLSEAINTATAVLIIACPCALALAIPFTYGSVLRLLGQQGLYLRSVKVVEDIQRITDIILDKTGTLTLAGHHHVVATMEDLHPTEASIILGMVQQSRHPKSRSLAQYFIGHGVEAGAINGIQEIPGKGLKYQEKANTYLVGSANFCGLKHRINSDVFISINGHC
ncbi:MAG: heavy metal translocating P-type ATPase metal-binding domain-containing protein, partial [Bacteroidota bacterium]